MSGSSWATQLALYENCNEVAHPQRRDLRHPRCASAEFFKYTHAYRYVKSHLGWICCFILQRCSRRSNHHCKLSRCLCVCPLMRVRVCVVCASFVREREGERGRGRGIVCVCVSECVCVCACDLCVCVVLYSGMLHLLLTLSYFICSLETTLYFLHLELRQSPTMGVQASADSMCNRLTPNTRCVSLLDPRENTNT